MKQRIFWFTSLLSLAGFSCGVFGFYTAEAKPLSEKFIHQNFRTAPKIHYLWLTPSYQKSVKSILGHPYPKIRIPYWRQGDQIAWVLEEPGKDLPITVGIILKKERGKYIIQSLRILKFRESRGWEITLPNFTRQFQQTKLKENRLAPSIDSISGATLSVNAVKKIAKLALTLTQSLETPNNH